MSPMIETILHKVLHEGVEHRAQQIKVEVSRNPCKERPPENTPKTYPRKEVSRNDNGLADYAKRLQFSIVAARSGTDPEVIWNHFYTLSEFSRPALMSCGECAKSIQRS